MIYLDSSAIVKMIRPEAESRDLVEWLNRSDEPAVTSVLAEVEVPRALRRSSPAHLAAMPAVLARISRIEMDAAVRATAGAYVTDALRSPDAVHLIAEALKIAFADRAVATADPAFVDVPVARLVSNFGATRSEDRDAG